MCPSNKFGPACLASHKMHCTATTYFTPPNLAKWFVTLATYTMVQSFLGVKPNKFIWNTKYFSFSKTWQFCQVHLKHGKFFISKTWQFCHLSGKTESWTHSLLSFTSIFSISVGSPFKGINYIELMVWQESKRWGLVTFFPTYQETIRELRPELRNKNRGTTQPVFCKLVNTFTEICILHFRCLSWNCTAVFLYHHRWKRI